MTEILEKQDVKISKLETENHRLKQRIRLLEKALFGPKSERNVDLDENQAEFEDLLKELDDLSTELNDKEVQVSSHKKHKKKSTLADLIPEDLPEEEIILDLPEEEKEGLTKIGEERSRKLAKKPASYYVKVYVRPKYAVKQDS